MRFLFVHAYFVQLWQNENLCALITIWGLLAVHHTINTYK
jgi:hypothetical protein